MTKYKVKIVHRALLDMEDIYDYIAEELGSPENALGQYNRIAKAIGTLAVFPKRARLVRFRLGCRAGYRQLVVDNYSVVYYIEGDEVIVARVLYGSSDIERRLLEK